MLFLYFNYYLSGIFFSCHCGELNLLTREDNKNDNISLTHYLLLRFLDVRASTPDLLFYFRRMIFLPSACGFLSSIIIFLDNCPDSRLVKNLKTAWLHCSSVGHLLFCYFPSKVFLHQKLQCLGSDFVFHFFFNMTAMFSFHPSFLNHIFFLLLSLIFFFILLNLCWYFIKHSSLDIICDLSSKFCTSRHVLCRERKLFHNVPETLPGVDRSF